ncbi:MAG: hypothetical protein WCK82_13870 [Bacteroidota bacterium]
MKLTIIPVDGTVSEDGKAYIGLDLSSCGIPADVHALQWQDTAGWIEYNSTIPNEPITELPAWANCCMTKWTEANTPVPPQPPTAEQNKSTAVSKLTATDWTTIPDVADPTKSNPYLSNVQDFVVYRNAVRQYAVYPVAGVINWSALPQEVWVKV